MLIDMGFMFGGPKWTASALQIQTRYALPHHIADRLTLKKLEPAIAALKAVSDDAIRDCFSDRPEEWLISEEDVEAGIHATVEARANIESVITAGNPQIQKGD